MLNDEIPGKISCYSSRAEIHKHIWSDIIYKPKLVGYEGIDGKPGTEPEFITEFQKYMNVVSDIEYRYTVDELEKLLLD